MLFRFFYAFFRCQDAFFRYQDAFFRSHNRPFRYRNAFFRRKSALLRCSYAFFRSQLGLVALSASYGSAISASSDGWETEVDPSSARSTCQGTSAQVFRVIPSREDGEESSDF